MTVPTRCPTFHPHPSSARADYELTRARDAVLTAIHQFHGSGRWQATRRWKLAGDPLCEDPFHLHTGLFGGEDGQTVASPVPAEGVHHVIALRDAWHLRLVRENLRSLCWLCHNQLDALYRTDPGRAVRLCLLEDEERKLRAGEYGGCVVGEPIPPPPWVSPKGVIKAEIQSSPHRPRIHKARAAPAAGPIPQL